MATNFSISNDASVRILQILEQLSNPDEPLSVTQTPDTSSTVTVNSTNFIITTATISPPLISDATIAFTINNVHIKSNSIVQIHVVDKAGTIGADGIPVLNVTDVTNGSCLLNISNVHGTNVLTGPITIHAIVK